MAERFDTLKVWELLVRLQKFVKFKISDPDYRASSNDTSSLLNAILGDGDNFYTGDFSPRSSYWIAAFILSPLISQQRVLCVAFIKRVSVFITLQRQWNGMISSANIQQLFCKGMSSVMSYFRKHEISVEITEKQMLVWAHVKCMAYDCLRSSRRLNM